VRRGFRIRTAVVSDDSSLIALQSDAEIPGGASVYRGHSFFGRSGLYERTRTLVVEMDAKLVGAATGAIKQVWLGARKQLVGHIFNVRVSASVRRMGVARGLIDALEAWFAAENVAAAYSFVGETNRPSRSLFARSGYEDLTQAAYLVAKRSPMPGDFDSAYVDIGADASWANMIVRPHDYRDFLPGNVMEALYAKRAVGGYLGTLVTGVEGTTSWLSIWDKDVAIGREPITPAYRSLFLFDVHLTCDSAWTALVTALFRRWPHIARLVAFMPARDIGCFGSQVVPTLDRIEIVMVRALKPLVLCDRSYLDIRD
jgi:ribosomal protein S18 acetylase RimI-like enzyme